MTHISKLPAPGAYARFLRTLATLPPDARVIDPLSGWHKRQTTAGELREAARVALMRRINSRGGNDAANEPIDVDLMRDARDLDDILRIRLRVYQFRTPMMRARFGHLLASRDD